MATAILGLPESIQKLMSSKSSYDEKLAEKLKTINTALSDYSSKYCIPPKKFAPGKTPLQKKSGKTEPHIAPKSNLALLKASHKGDFEKVKRLVFSGKCDVNVVAEDGSSALIVASRMGHADIVKFLIEHGSEVNAADASNFTALMGACQHGHYEVVKLLLAHGTRPNMQTSVHPITTALLLAVMRNSYQIVQLLLESGADSNTLLPSIEPRNTNALNIAIAMQNYGIAKLLLEKGADPNAVQDTLLLATEMRSQKTIKLLLEKGALVNMVDENGGTALMVASRRGFYNIAKLLLEFGASVNLQSSDGSCALRLSCSGGHHKVAALLLKRGAHVDIIDHHGSTPLFAATVQGHYKVIQLLIHHGAQLDQQNRLGASALCTACVCGHYEIAKLLIERGAVVDTVNTCIKLGYFVVSGHMVAIVAYAGFYDIVKLLLDNGTQPNAICSITDHDGCEFSALVAACIGLSNQVDIVKLLLDYGADPNRLVGGNYSLHYVVKEKKAKREFIELLLSRGALPSLRNHERHSALMEATQARNYENVEILLESSLVEKVDLWQTLQFAVNLNIEKAIPLLLEQCKQMSLDNRVFLADTDYPRIVFWDAPIHCSITSQGAIIQPPHTGISLSIPEQALSSTEENVDLLIHPCIGGPFELPPGYESASPAYLIQPSRRVKFHMEVTLQIHHYASLQSEEECEGMSFLSASPTPQYRRSKPVYIFKEIKHSEGIFRPNNQIGEIRLQHFCLTKIGRKRKDNTLSGSSASKKRNTGTYCSARLYRSTSPQNIIRAVFCMCLYHPLYIKHCDNRIAKDYKALSCEGEARSDSFVKMIADEATLVVSNSDGWSVTFDKKPTKIRKRDVDLPNLFDVDLSELTDYPPKFSIFTYPTHKATRSVTPQLVVEGLDVECSFEIIIPSKSTSQLLIMGQGSSGYSCGRTTSLSPAPSHHSQSSSSQAGPSFTARFEAEVGVDSQTSLNLSNILPELVSISKEWTSLAIVLGLEHEIEEIEANYPTNVKKCKEEVIARWLRSGCGSWCTLCDALRNKLVQHAALAEGIEKKYCTRIIRRNS